MTASSHDECVIRLVQQDGGQAGDGFVQRYRCESTAFGRLQSVGCSREQFDDRWVAVISGFLESIEDRFARIAGLANLVSASLDKFPEGLAKGCGQRLDVQDDIEVFGGVELQLGLSMVKLAAVPPIKTYWSAYSANLPRKTSSPLTMAVALSVRPARVGCSHLRCLAG